MNRKSWDRRPPELPLPFAALFHGTSEHFDTQLRGGAFDGLVWTAATPDIAQNYIPSAGIRTRLYCPDQWERDDPFRPDRGLAMILYEMIGVELREIERDGFGNAVRWASSRSLKKGEVADFVENELGYPRVGGRYFDLKLGFVDQKEVLHPAGYRKPGRLFILRPPPDLRVLDLAEALDWNVPTYDAEKLPLFRQAAKHGFDAVWTPDQAQSKNWGNVEHMSLALFPHVIPRCEVATIPAVNFDWGEEQPISFGGTPEFDAWRAGRAVAEANDRATALITTASESRHRAAIMV